MLLTQKIVAAEDLTRVASSAPRPMVFTNGVFDLIHPGHVAYLEEARALGVSLFVGLNSDSSVRLLDKGPDRPINSEDDRAVLLAALESVSFVALFDEADPIALLGKVRPDIYVKGGDYDVEDLKEAVLVKSWGGRAQSLPFVGGRSTTQLLDRIRARSA